MHFFEFFVLLGCVAFCLATISFNSYQFFLVVLMSAHSVHYHKLYMAKMQTFKMPHLSYLIWFDSQQQQQQQQLPIDAGEINTQETRSSLNNMLCSVIKTMYWHTLSSTSSIVTLILPYTVQTYLSINDS